MKSMRLDKRTIIVTGGSTGIGEALAKRFGAEGARVAIVNRSRESGEAAAQAIRATGGIARAFPCDLRNIAAHAALIEEVVGTFGSLDALVNNAGTYLMTPLGETDAAAFDDTIATNLRAPFFLSQAALPALRQSRGAILNIGSIFGHDGFPGSSVYCATKAGIELMTKTLALELRAVDVRVNALAPGWIETPINAGYRANDQEFMRRASERFGGGDPWMKPDALAGTATFLLSDDAHAVTGVTVYVDKGWSAY